LFLFLHFLLSCFLVLLFNFTSHSFVVNSSDTICCMASVLGFSSTIVTSYESRNEPKLCTKFSAKTCSTLCFSWINHHGKMGRKHFQLRSSNGHPLNAVSSHDGVYVFYVYCYLSLYDSFLCCCIVVIVKLNFICIKMVMCMPCYLI
jgi:hypothetical protein